MGVRRAVLGDEALVRALRLQALADAPDAFDSTLEYESAMTPADWSLWISSGATFVFEQAGGAIGIAAGVPCDRDPAAILLISMWVHPRARGTGTADALVASVLAWAAARAAHEIVLHVGKRNDRARRFYERVGFRVTGHEFRSEHTGIEEVEMRLALGGGSK